MLCTILEKQTSLDRVNQTFALSPRGGCEHQTTLDAGSRCWRPTCTAYIACAPRALVCGDGCGVVPDIRERSLSLGKSCVSQVKVKSGREGGRVLLHPPNCSTSTTGTLMVASLQRAHRGGGKRLMNYSHPHRKTPEKHIDPLFFPLLVLACAAITKPPAVYQTPDTPL